MTRRGLPTKLKKEPLVDALFEVRLASPAHAIGSILPGLLFTRLSSPHHPPPKIERLPMAGLPEQVRNANPFFKYQASLRVVGHQFSVSIGESSITLACHLPYPGWTTFKSQIVDVMRLVREIAETSEIERYSLKYANVIEGDKLDEQIGRTNLSLSFGNHKLASEVFSLRVELPREPFVHIVQIASSALVTLADGSIRSGLLIDVDTVKNDHNRRLLTFLDLLDQDLDSIHIENKKLFFECLTPETTDQLEPSYDAIS
jgi:uncharacterized protein (TIGR04255 family)